jgi:hypothetical protein
MKNQVTIKSNGHGHYKITTNYYNKEISCITTNTIAIDDASDGKLLAIKELRKEIIRKNKNN